MAIQLVWLAVRLRTHLLWNSEVAENEMIRFAVFMITPNLAVTTVPLPDKEVIGFFLQAYMDNCLSGSRTGIS